MSPKAPSNDDRLRELGKQLPWERPDAERGEAVRSSLLVAATEDDAGSHRKRWLLVGGGFAAGALAAAAIALVIARPHAAEPIRPREAHARVDAPASARLEHTVTATASGTDELVRVRAGTVRLAVPAVRAGDRVRLQTADATVEGRGAYEVVVAADRLERVTVTAGTARVDVRVDGQPRQVFLAAGQTWRPTISTAELELPAPSDVPAHHPPAARVEPAATPAPAPIDVRAPGAAAERTGARVASARRVDGEAREASTDEPGVPGPTTPSTPPSSATSASPSTTPTPDPLDAGVQPRMPAVTALETAPTAPTSPRQATATERHFQAGWALLRDGKAREAAIALGRAADGGGDDPLAADARYFQAVALVRSNQRREAERVLVAFLDRAPRSLRRGRAAVLLGALLRDRGEVTSARAWFSSALDDADPAIAAAARAHLSGLPAGR